MARFKLGRFVLRSGWSVGLAVACSRTALESPERLGNELNIQGGRKSLDASGGTQQLASGGTASLSESSDSGSIGFESNPAGAAGSLEGSPTTSSLRWIAISAFGRDGKSQIYGMRFGSKDIEDFVRLDPAKGSHDSVQGKFSSEGRGYALRVEERTNLHAERLVDFNATKPKFIDLSGPTGGRLNQFGPWLDDHRIIVYEKLVSDDFSASNCRVIDLDRLDSPLSIGNFGIPGASCSGNFDISPSRRWIHAVANTGQGLALLMAHVTKEGLGDWTNVIDLPAGQAPARATYGYDESFMYLQKTDLKSHVIVGDVDIVRLGDVPEVIAAFSLPSEERLNYVLAAPSGSRFLTHTTRISAGGGGTNPVRVVDAETGASAIVTPQYLATYARGFTWGGQGVLIAGYVAETEQVDIDWFDLSDASKSPAPHKLTCANGAKALVDLLTADGGKWYGICGEASSWSYPLKGPVTLERHDFAPTLNGPDLLSTLTEHANVTDTLFSPDNTALVYSAMADAGTDPVLAEYSGELGTFWVSLAGGPRRRLALAWSEEALHWLPNTEGLLRLGTQSSSIDAADVTWAEHWSASDWPTGDTHTLHWLRFDEGAGVTTDLTAYLSFARNGANSVSIDVPDRWMRRSVP